MNVTGIRVPRIGVNEYLLSLALTEAGLNPLQVFDQVADDLRQTGEVAAENAARQAVTARFREMLGWSPEQWRKWED